MDIAALAFLVGAFVGGFLLAGRWVKNVGIQLLLGAVLGVAIVFVLIASFLGIAFAGCLLTGAGPDFK